MIVFIPIKTNSQRVDGKNFRMFHGKPLWSHCVNKLKDFDVWVDTDSPEIYEECLGISYVTPINRREGLIGDNVSVVDILKDFVDTNHIKDPMCQVHVTSPFLSVRHIHESFSILDQGYDSVFSVNKVQSRFWKCFKDGHNYPRDRVLPVNHDPKKLLPTQLLTPWYEENSYLYTLMPSVLNACNNRIGNSPYMLEIEFPYNIDIDVEDDWKLACSIKDYE